MLMLRSFSGLMIALSLLGYGLPQAATALNLLRLTPTGNDVPPSRQIVLQFDRPVVPLGRMERRADEVPIRIEPVLACGWRWLNPDTLACQLDDESAMAPATRYTVTLRPGLQARDGAVFNETTTRTFITQRPKVDYVWFETWKAPGLPELEVMFDQPVQGASIAQHLYIQTPDAQRVAVQARPSPNGNQRFWLMTPETELPQDTQVELRVEPGIVSAQGPEPGIEQRTVVAFDTFPAFRFLGIRCTPNHQETVTIAAAEPLDSQQKCNPLRRVSLLFSAPVVKEAVKDRLHIIPDLSGDRDDVDPWDTVHTPSRLSFPHTKGKAYPVPLPRGLRAHTVYQLIADHPRITDVFGRSLPQAVNMRAAMDHRPPAYHLNHPISVLEQQVDTHLPLVVTNLERVQIDYEALTVDGRQTGQSYDLTLDKVEDIAQAIPLKVRELIPGSSGAIQGRLRTTPQVEREPQWFFAQVTPFHVHVKLGHYNTLVWVTRFDNGLPVPDASVHVEIETFAQFADTPKIVATGVTDSDGIARLAGAQSLDPDLNLLQNGRRFQPHLTVRVQHEGDLALVSLIYDFRVRAYGPNKSYVPTSSRRQFGHIHTWGATAQGVYKAGDTIQYKFYVRDQNNHRFVPSPTTGYSLKIMDPTDKVVHEIADLSLSDFGSYHGEFTVPAQGAVGWYRFVLSLSETPHSWEPLRVLISDFTPAPFRVTTELHGKQFAPNDMVAVTTRARLHAGGPYADAETRLTAQVRGRALQPEDSRAAGFWFDVLQHTGTETVFQTEAQVDSTGTLETSFTIQAAEALYGELLVESAVRDDRGKTIAHQGTARYAGRDRYVGVRQEDWVLQASEAAQLQVVVVDDQGRMATGTPIQVKIEQLQTKAAQVKGAGNTYLTHYVHEWVHAASCSLISTTAAEVCSFVPPAPGTYKMTASIKDTQGRSQQSHMQRWAVGPGEVVWESPPGHALQLTPEHPEVSVGDTARYLVQNPYPGAQALITIERYGVQKSWRQTFDNSLEMIEFPITSDHLPGFYLSVLVMSPRVAKPLGDNQVDLGKPAFRLGYVRVPVRDKTKALLVAVKPRRPTYKPRQTATIDLQVTTRQGDTPPVELAVAVLDEAVFDLIKGGRSYFDPYAGFYTLEALDVRNFNLLTHLIGRQKFEKKGANPGGGGGDLGPELRSVFEFVSYWNPSLRPDQTGKATIEFPLPDNLTGWRVLAMAVTPTDRMGLGDGQFTVNQPIEIRPALPNQVTAGDRFEARFTVMNRTDTARALIVSLQAAGP
ncbi:MAG: MG2 domain-containing protein, partial [Candidatus Tectomicrobia bacterium]|nr:MG2 domain-containing protein [Candidatus Tectomicrobia bacterium]